MVKIKGITIEIGGDTTRLQSALKGVEGQIRGTQQKLKDVNRLLKLDPGNTELLAQKQKLLGKEVEGTKQKLDTLKKASEEASRTAGKWDEYQRAMEPVQKEIDETEKKLGELRQAKEKADEEFKAGKISKEDYDKIQAECKETEDKLKDLKKQAKETADEFGNPISPDQYDALQREIIETEQALQNLERQAEQSDVALQKIGAKGTQLKKVGDQIAGVGKGMSTYVTAPLVAAGAVAAGKFAEVDKTMQLANKTMGNTVEQAGILDKAMKDAAANSTFGMNDAANASLNFARAGLTAEQAAAALAPSMNLAAGEGGNLDTVSAGLVATINGFHGSFDDAGKYADVFASACNNSALDVDSLSHAMSVAAPIFSSAGYKVNDAALYMGVMANNGIDADKAANSLKTGLAKLVSPAKQGAEMMDSLGISVTNTDGSMKDSVTIQKELHDAFHDLSESEQIAAASAIFGKNQMAPWLALINTAPEDVGKLDKSLKDCAGTTDEMSEAMMSGFGGSIEQLKSSLDVLMTSLGQLLAKYLTPVIKMLQGWMNAFNKLSPSMQNVVVVIGMVVAAIGPLLLFTGKMLGAVGTVMEFAPKLAGLGGTIGKGIGLIKGALSGLFGLIAAHPVVAIIAGIAALVAAIVHLYKTNEAFRNIVNAVWGAVKKTIMAVVNAIAGFLNGAWDGITSVAETAWNGIRDFFSGIWKGIQKVFTTVVDTIGSVLSGAWSRMEAVASSVWNGILGVFGTVWSGIQSVFSTALDRIQSGISTAFNTAKTFISTTWNTISSVLSGIVSGIKTKVVNAFGQLVSGIREKLSAVTGVVKSGFQGAIDFITSLPAKALQWGKDFIGGIINGISGMIGKVKEAASGVASAVASVLHFSRPDEGPLREYEEWMPDFMHGLAQGILDNSGEVKQAIRSVALEILQEIRELVQEAFGAGSGVSEDVGKAVEKAASGRKRKGKKKRRGKQGKKRDSAEAVDSLMMVSAEDLPDFGKMDAAMSIRDRLLSAREQEEAKLEQLKSRKRAEVRTEVEKAVEAAGNALGAVVQEAVLPGDEVAGIVERASVQLQPSVQETVDGVKKKAEEKRKSKSKAKQKNRAKGKDKGEAKSGNRDESKEQSKDREKVKNESRDQRKAKSESRDKSRTKSKTGSRNEAKSGIESKTGAGKLSIVVRDSIHPLMKDSVGDMLRQGMEAVDAAESASKQIRQSVEKGVARLKRKGKKNSAGNGKNKAGRPLTAAADEVKPVLEGALQPGIEAVKAAGDVSKKLKEPVKKAADAVRRRGHAGHTGKLKTGSGHGRSGSGSSARNKALSKDKAAQKDEFLLDAKTAGEAKKASKQLKSVADGVEVHLKRKKKGIQNGMKDLMASVEHEAELAVPVVQGEGTNSLLGVSDASVEQCRNQIVNLLNELKPMIRQFMQEVLVQIRDAVAAAGKAASEVKKKLRKPEQVKNESKGKGRNKSKDLLKGIRGDSPEITSAGMKSGGAVKAGNDAAGMELVKKLADTLAKQQAQQGAGKDQHGDIVIPVYLGNTILDEVVVSAQQRANLRSGGR